MQEIWCLGSDRITREFHLTEQIDVGSETSRQFATQYFAGNGRRIPVIRQISVNRSVKIVGIPSDACGCGGTKILTIKTGLLSRGGLTTTSLPHGVLMSLPVLLTSPGVQIIHALLSAASVMTPFAVGIMIAWEVPPQVATLSVIQGSIVVVMIGRVWLINNYFCESLFQVSVTFPFFPSLV